jgi:hypothetical protein
MTTNTITDAVKHAQAKRQHATQAALGHVAVTDAEANAQVADHDYLAHQRQQRALAVEQSDQELGILTADVAARTATVAALRSQLAGEEADLQQRQTELDLMRRRIADLTPRARKRVIVDFARPDLDPDVPPPSLALVRPDEWRRLFQDARARRTVSAITWISEVLGVVLEAEHHTAR